MQKITDIMMMMMVAVSVGNLAFDNHFSWIPLLFIIDNEDIHERVPVSACYSTLSNF